MNVEEVLSKEWQLDRDIRRTIILYSYIKNWGMPVYRANEKITIKKQEESYLIEIYIFPPLPDRNNVFRIATIGISYDFYPSKNDVPHYELMMALPGNLGGEDLDDIISYFLVIITSTLAYKNDIKEGFTLIETVSEPIKWKQNSILIDIPAAESEELELFQIGSQVVNLYIALPIYQDECNFIRNNGIEVFDDLCEAADLSIIDLSRNSFIKG